MTNPEEIFEAFKKQTVLVVGDVMVDAYLWGKVDRISPEAPVPVVHITKKENRLGGSANVALNLVELGAKPIICSVIGDDWNGKEMISLMESKGMVVDGLVTSTDRVTTVKTRVISNHQQMLRIDEEYASPLNKKEEEDLIRKVSTQLESKKIDVVILEDYNKGVLTEKVIESIISLCNSKNIPTCVDPKKDNFFAYKNVTLFKPNLKELREGLKIDIDINHETSLSNAVIELEKRINPAISLITLSERGVYWKKEGKEEIIPAHRRNISDVSGAGDTVIAVAALCLAMGMEAKMLAALSNLAGGWVCEHTGVVPVNAEKLLAEAKQKLK